MFGLEHAVIVEIGRNDPEEEVGFPCHDVALEHFGKASYLLVESAATSDAYASTRLIADASRAVGVATPVLDLSSELYGESLALGPAADLHRTAAARAHRAPASEAAGSLDPRR